MAQFLFLSCGVCGLDFIGFAIWSTVAVVIPSTSKIVWTDKKADDETSDSSWMNITTNNQSLGKVGKCVVTCASWGSLVMTF